ncbi:hypothetical protein B0H17DRAFT_1335110 [Mycena rosella]|uniref:Uncharacterized protein n=1 Tax=Mycena rosella TaxID=1033263 RepID=A0AAD7D207_MYCRO|nr:hypothetical protein B0H17DRAFT_1335110 [Mycena rosella]
MPRLPMHVLYCGAQDGLGVIYDDDSWTTVPSNHKFYPFRSNPHGRPPESNRMWRAVEMEGHRFVIPMEERYFSADALEQLRLGGNALGALDESCGAHQTSKNGKNYYIFLPSAVSPPIPPAAAPFVRHASPPRAQRSAPPPVAGPPQPPILPHYLMRRRHPTSPPLQILYAEFTPTPSPEIVPVSLPPEDAGAQQEDDEGFWARAFHSMARGRLSAARED